MHVRRRSETVGRGARVTMAAVSVVATLVMSAGMSGCVATESPPPPRGYVVNGPPPAPLAETRPAPPASDPRGPAPVWVAGYWHWVGAQYAWIPGHWETPPRGARWAAPQYTSRDGQYFYAPGDWQGGQPGPSGQPGRVMPANANAFH